MGDFKGEILLGSLNVPNGLMYHKYSGLLANTGELECMT